MNFVRKLTNRSDADVPVDTDHYTRIFLKPGGVIENKHVQNLDSIRQFCKIEEDLSEVGEATRPNTGRQYLKG